MAKKNATTAEPAPNAAISTPPPPTRMRNELARFARETEAARKETAADRVASEETGRQCRSRTRQSTKHWKTREPPLTTKQTREAYGIPASTDQLQALNGRSRPGLGGGRRGCALRHPTTGPDWGREEEAELLGGSTIPEGVLEEVVDRRNTEIQADMEDAPLLTPPMGEDMRESGAGSSP